MTSQQKWNNSENEKRRAVLYNLGARSDWDLRVYSESDWNDLPPNLQNRIGLYYSNPEHRELCKDIWSKKDE